MKIRAALIALALTAPLLQGCLPVIAGGIAAGALAVDDRRTLGAQTEDKTIDVKAETRINEKLGSKAHINVTSFNRKVLLTGEVPGEQMKKDIEQMIRWWKHLDARSLNIAGPREEKRPGIYKTTYAALESCQAIKID